MSSNYDDLFNEVKLLNDFEEFMKQEELEIYYERDFIFDKYIEYFISNHYWNDLNKYFMNPENLNDITLIRYIMETAEYTVWDEIEKKMSSETIILFIREKIYNTAIFTKLNDMLINKVDDILTAKCYENWNLLFLQLLLP
jgi:hypothetical protein